MIEPNPSTTAQEEWALWTNYIYGLIRSEREDRAIERDCVRRLKKEGVIR